MNLEDIRRLVGADVKMDKTELDLESIKTPQLHNKYLILFSDEKLILGKLKSDFNILRKNKWLYYTGKLSLEQLEDFGWDTFDLNILKSDIDKFLDGDDDMITLANRILLQQEKVNYLESVIKIINNRQWNIRSAIDWLKFTNGI
jgi:hypothetical protein|tara:strand:+ start:266 stop:700 length:435 start_codon:yes stop_codon:yes gene_type:complete